MDSYRCRQCYYYSNTHVSCVIVGEVSEQLCTLSIISTTLDRAPLLSSSLQFSSVQGGVYALRKAHMRSTPSRGRFPKVAVETVPMFV